MDDTKSTRDDSSNRSNESIPFVTFNGHLKQIDVSSARPEFIRLFELVFGQFRSLYQLHTAFSNSEIEIISSAGVHANLGQRARRFSGGKGLRPGSYFSICENLSGLDYGTLRNEMLAYYSQESGVIARLFDTSEDSHLLEQMFGLPPNSIQDSTFYIIYTIVRETEDNKVFGVVGTQISAKYNVEVRQRSIENVIDLRRPSVQDWFVEKFVGMELAAEASAAESTGRSVHKEKITTFPELLRNIASPEVGGGMSFNQAVGDWLRNAGANALIFPSARTNTACRTQNDEPMQSIGWNMVMYEGAETQEPKQLFGRVPNWLSGASRHFRIRAAINQQPQSLQIRGLEEYNLLSVDAKFRLCFEHEKTKRSVDPTSHIERKVTEFLSSEESQNQLWTSEIDHHAFLDACQKNWPSIPPIKKMEHKIPPSQISQIQNTVLALLSQPDSKALIAEVDPFKSDYLDRYAHTISSLITNGGNPDLLGDGDVCTLGYELSKALSVSDDQTSPTGREVLAVLSGRTKDDSSQR